MSTFHRRHDQEFDSTIKKFRKINKLLERYEAHMEKYDASMMQKYTGEYFMAMEKVPHLFPS